ncbi:hypothetical protein N9C31_03100 [Gammaproteobacteria bacterium]|nr:hypothetical protein [Gammaproteobacteria bacterium]
MNPQAHAIRIQGLPSILIANIALLLNLREPLLLMVLTHRLIQILPVITSSFLLQYIATLTAGFVVYRILSPILAHLFTPFTIGSHHTSQNASAFSLISGLLLLSIGWNMLVFSSTLSLSFSALSPLSIYVASAIALSLGFDRLIIGINSQARSQLHKMEDVPQEWNDLHNKNWPENSSLSWTQGLIVVGAALFSLQTGLMATVLLKFINHLFCQYSEIETDKKFVTNQQNFLALKNHLLQHPTIIDAPNLNLISRSWLYLISSPLSIRLYQLNDLAKAKGYRDESHPTILQEQITKYRSLFDLPILNIIQRFTLGLISFSKKIACAPQHFLQPQGDVNNNGGGATKTTPPPSENLTPN